jgi:hypothetical protein
MFAGTEVWWSTFGPPRTAFTRRFVVYFRTALYTPQTKQQGYRQALGSGYQDNDLASITVLKKNKLV